jgi:hypothetical protein
MAGTPDLFVVCKNCRAEVSPYITECPYCGHRLRKRAPKLDKGAAPRRERVRRSPVGPPLGRLRSGEIPGIRAENRPYVALALFVVPALATLLWRAGAFDAGRLLVFGGTHGDWWSAITTNFFYTSTAYEICVLGTCFLFAWLLERRHGHWAPLLVFAGGTAAGMALTLATDPHAFALGANAGALALLGAWAVRDLLALRRGEEVEADLLGVAAIAIVLALLPAAVEEAHPIAGAGGAVAGLILGVPLARLSRVR